LASTAPQLFGQAEPERLKRIAGSGLPLLVMPAWKDWSAPSSTEEEPGESETVMSLEMVRPAVEDLEGSTWLAAVI
jgi:hypothetical protein